MNDREFLDFCADYPDYLIEATAEGEILIMPPTHWITGARGARILSQPMPLRASFCPTAPAGLRTRPGFPTTAFAGVAPDSWHVCPEFVIELKSPSDRLRVLRDKMDEWIDNGAILGWLIDPDRKAVEIYRSGRLPEIRTGIEEIKAEAPVAGFVLDLRPVWAPIGANSPSPE